MKKINIIIAITIGIIAMACNKDDGFKQIPEHKEDKNVVPGVYIGAVGFNDSVYTRSLTDTINRVTEFIDGLSNNRDATALCYGMSKGLDLMKAAESKAKFDYVFMITFTDGLDNYSSNYFSGIYQNEVVSHTANLLNTTTIDKNKVRSYTIGLEGDGVIIENDLTELAVNGLYKAASPSTLENTFESIANTVIDAAKDISIVTNAVPIKETEPKYMQISIKVQKDENTVTTYVMEGELYNEDGESPIFKVITTPEDVEITFDYTAVVNDLAIIEGSLELKDGISKAIIPLTNLKIRETGNELSVAEVSVKYRYSSDKPWSIDVEDSKIESEVLNNIGVVLVIDCSKSLGAEFENVKTYAKDLIETLANSKE